MIFITARLSVKYHNNHIVASKVIKGSRTTRHHNNHNNNNNKNHNNHNNLKEKKSNKKTKQRQRMIFASCANDKSELE